MYKILSYFLTCCIWLFVATSNAQSAENAMIYYKLTARTIPESANNLTPIIRRSPMERSSSKSPPRARDHGLAGSPPALSHPQSSNPGASSGRGTPEEANNRSTGQRKAQLTLNAVGNKPKPYLNLPGSNGTPQIGKTYEHPSRISGGLKTASSLIKSKKPNIAAVTTKGDRVEAYVKPAKDSRGGYMSYDNPWKPGSTKVVEVKPGDTHTHVSTNGGKGPLRSVAAELDGPGEVYASAEMYARRE